tara:strand:- start:53 stop:406 length:354 start_codon:yes stop_codon:yes gene_type:complete
MTKNIKRIFKPLNATVIHVNKPLSVEQLDNIFGDLDYDMRYYQTEDGWDIRFCYDEVGNLNELNDADIRIEKDAWDHEDCHLCEIEIIKGDQFYTIHKSDNSTFIYCESCQSKQNET